eukprot:1822261-Pyramimonas_sp.AAC.1
MHPPGPRSAPPASLSGRDDATWPLGPNLVARLLESSILPPITRGGFRRPIGSASATSAARVCAFLIASKGGQEGVRRGSGRV